jgi:hypothetical protein
MDKIDKKEYNAVYFQNHKERIYYNYKKRYHEGKCLNCSKKPNWYITGKYKARQEQALKTQQDAEQSKQLEEIVVRFFFE